MMRKTGENSSPVGAIVPAVVSGLLITLLLMLIGALLVQRGVVGAEGIRPLALLFLALGCAAAACFAAKRAPGRKFVWAMSAGAVVFLLLAGGGMLSLRQEVHIVRLVISALCALVASALGGYAGANMRKKKRYSHVKK